MAGGNSLNMVKIKIIIKESVEDIHCGTAVTSQGVIPPNMEAMSIKDAAKLLGLLKDGPAGAQRKWDHARLEWAYEVQKYGNEAGRLHQKIELFKDWVFITNGSNYYTYMHPEYFNYDAWTNAVDQIDLIRQKCGEPGWKDSLYFETRAGRTYNLSGIKTNKEFITFLTRRATPASSMTRQFRESKKSVKLLIREFK